MEFDPYKPPASDKDALTDPRPTGFLAAMAVRLSGFAPLLSLPFAAGMILRDAPEHRAALAAFGAAAGALLLATAYIQLIGVWARYDRRRGGTAEGSTMAVVLAVLGALMATLVSITWWLAMRPY